MTLQAVILLSFSDSLPHSFSELIEELNFTEEILKRTLHSLVCGKFKVLKRLDEATEKEKSIIKTSDIFIINEQFR